MNLRSRVHLQPTGNHGLTRIPALDGIRGLAILIVFVGHVALFGPGAGASSGIRRFLGQHAGAGVSLFFVLSGFLITGILYDSKGSPFYFARFFSRRVLRIFPLYYTVLAGVLFAQWVFPDLYALKSITPAAHVANWTYTSNVLIALRGWGAEPAFLGHFWSLAVEEQFYLIWPFLVLAMSREGLIRACFAGIIGALVVRYVLMTQINYEAAYALLPSRFDALLIGAVLALFGRRESGAPEWIESSLIQAVPIVLYLMILISGTAVSGRSGAVGPSVSLSVEPLAFGGLLAALLYGRGGLRLNEIFTSRFLRFFGKYSYAIYVFHVAVIIALPRIIRWVCDTLGIAPLHPGVVTFGLIALSISVAAALVSWNLLEKWALALKDRLVFSSPSLANDRAPFYVS